VAYRERYSSLEEDELKAEWQRVAREAWGDDGRVRQIAPDEAARILARLRPES